MIMNGEQLGTLKKTAVAYFKALPRHSLGGTEENHKNQMLGYPGCLEYKSKTFCCSNMLGLTLLPQ
jgi:hypothetical protein